MGGVNISSLEPPLTVEKAKHIYSGIEERRISNMLKILLGVVTSLAPLISAEKMGDLPLFTFSSVRFGDLLMGDKTTSLLVAHSLTSLGGLEISDIPNFGESRSTALRHLAECLENDITTPSAIMKDGSRRLTTAGSASAEMTGECGDSASNLRSIVDGTVAQLLRVLDIASSKANVTPIEIPAYSFDDIGRLGSHLEHMHSYFPAKNIESTDQDSIFTMDMHTDSGLLIAMTTGFYTSPDDPAEGTDTPNGLIIQLPSGQMAQVESSDDSLIIMVGAGGADWLSPVLGSPLRALPHALKIPPVLAAQGGSRSWYGKMYLPPWDANLPGTNGITYGQYRRSEVQTMAASAALDHEHSVSFPTACSGLGSGRSQSYSYIAKNVLCGSDNSGVMCWTQCMDTSDLPCGTNAECVDTVTGEVVDGTDHCPESDMSLCELQCVGGHDVNGGGNTSSSNDFCYGSGVTMYMDGFYSTLQEERGDTACVNLFFTDWTLNTSVKYCFACLGIFAAGMFVEFLTFCRKHIVRRHRWSIPRDVFMVLLHGIQVMLGYLLMLAAMSYNVELFVMVVLGLMCGYACFNLASPPKSNLDPCCADTDIEDVYHLMGNDTHGKKPRPTPSPLLS